MRVWCLRIQLFIKIAGNIQDLEKSQGMQLRVLAKILCENILSMNENRKKIKDLSFFSPFASSSFW